MKCPEINALTEIIVTLGKDIMKIYINKPLQPTDVMTVKEKKQFMKT